MREIDTSETRSAFLELLDLLEIDESIDPDDGLWLRVADLDIELTAAETTLARASGNPAGSAAMRDTVALKLIELEQQLTGLAQDILGYYSLPQDRAGENEPGIGGECSKRLRSRFLAARLQDESAVLRIRDRLASFLGSDAS